MITVSYSDRSAEFVVEPEHGRRVVFTVEERTIDLRDVHGGWGHRPVRRFVVGLKGSRGVGFSHHMTFELACHRALVRANRYDKAYAVPRGLARSA